MTTISGSRLSLQARMQVPLLAAFWLGLLVFVACLWHNVLVLDGKFTPDSIFYIDAAQNLMQGRGLSMSAVEIHGFIEGQDELPEPFTLWAPLYSLLIALLSSFGVAPPAAALTISVAFLMITYVAVFFMIRSISDAWTALLCVAFLTHFAPLLSVASHAWSETLALALAFLSFYLLLKRTNKNERSMRRYITAGVLAGAAVAARYAFLPVFVVGLYAINRDKGARGSWRQAIAFIGPFTLIAGAVFMRNYIAKGRIAGVPNASLQPTVLGDLATLATEVPRAMLADDFFMRAIQVSLIIVFALRAAQSIYKRHVRQYLGFLQRTHPRALVLWALVYFALLLASRMRYSIDTLGDRLLLPGTLALYILVMVAALRVIRMKRFAVAGIAFLVLAMSLIPAMQSTHTIYGARILRAYDFEEKGQRSETIDWLRTHTDESTLLIAENGFDLPIYLGPSDIAFYSQAITPGTLLTHEDLLALIVKLDACGRYDRVLLLANTGLSLPSPVEQRFGPRLATLFANPPDTPAGITILEKFDDGTLFELDCDAAATE